jgi:hypothetical protein
MKEKTMSLTATVDSRKAAWHAFLDWLFNASLEEMEQLEAALLHLPQRMSLLQALDHALAHEWSRQTVPASLLSVCRTQTVPHAMALAAA